MKKLISLLLIAVLGLPACAAPLPERKGGTIKLECEPATQPEVVAVTFWRSLPADTSWTNIGTYPVTTTTITVTNSSYGETFYATFKDSLGNESDPSNMITNNVTLSAPGKLKISR